MILHFQTTSPVFQMLWGQESHFSHQGVRRCGFERELYVKKRGRQQTSQRTILKTTLLVYEKEDSEQTDSNGRKCTETGHTRYKTTLCF